MMTHQDPDQQEQYLSDSPRDSDNLHASIQEHIRGCEQCTFVTSSTKPRGFFSPQQSKMCAEYFKIVAMLTGAPLPDAMGGRSE